jgi:hypothetical protein
MQSMLRCTAAYGTSELPDRRAGEALDRMPARCCQPSHDGYRLRGWQRSVQAGCCRATKRCSAPDPAVFADTPRTITRRRSSNLSSAEITAEHRYTFFQPLRRFEGHLLFHSFVREETTAPFQLSAIQQTERGQGERTSVDPWSVRRSSQPLPQQEESGSEAHCSLNPNEERGMMCWPPGSAPRAAPACG